MIENSLSNLFVYSAADLKAVAGDLDTMINDKIDTVQADVDANEVAANAAIAANS